MPYLITTTTPPTGSPRTRTAYTMYGTVTRTAVATLDEAQRAAVEACALAEAGGKAGVWDVRFAPFEYAAAELPEEGGTVGPLPDGTVIEVRPVTLAALADLAGWPAPPLDEFTPDLIAAFNARQ